MIAIGRKLLLTGLLLAGPAGCWNSNGPPPIYLGHVANLSDADHAGTHAEQGIRLALQGLTDDKIGEALQGHPLHVRHTDTRGQLDASEAEAVRLATMSRVAGIIGGATPEEIARLDRARVPVLAPAGMRPPGASDMVFAIGMQPSLQGKLLAKYAAHELNLADVVVVFDERREDFTAAAEAFNRLFAEERSGKNKGPAAPMTLRFGKDANWEELAKAIAGRETARGLLFAGKARDWVELGRKLPAVPILLFAGEDGEAANLPAPSGKQAIYVATAFAADPDAPRAQAFIQKYRDAFKAEPDVAAALGYESLQIFAEALKQAGSAMTLEKLQSALKDLKDFPGLCGTLSMNKDLCLRRPLYIARLDGGAPTMLKRYEAEQGAAP